MDAIRPHVLGRFRDLLGAVANSWAMMSYLDNYLSSARAINENYARELMELHTLGVDGGYTQADVQEVARAFTGWGIDQRAGAFVFRAGAHDQAAKTVLGQRLPASQGKKDGEDVLDLLARHPSTARFISTKLCRRLVSDTPSEAVVARGAEAFTSSERRLWPRCCARSSAPPTSGTRRSEPGKIKTPARIRGERAARDRAPRSPRARAFVEGRGGSSLTSMGMPTYEALDPTGWSDRGTDWLPNPGSHLARMNFVLALVSQTTDGVAVDLRDAHRQRRRGRRGRGHGRRGPAHLRRHDAGRTSRARAARWARPARCQPASRWWAWPWPAPPSRRGSRDAFRSLAPHLPQRGRSGRRRAGLRPFAPC